MDPAEREADTLREKVQACALMVCLFIFLFIVLGTGLRLSEGGALLAAATGTPVIACGFRRMCGRPSKQKDAREMPIAEGTVDKLG